MAGRVWVGPLLQPRAGTPGQGCSHLLVANLLCVPRFHQRIKQAPSDVEGGEFRFD